MRQITFDTVDDAIGVLRYRREPTKNPNSRKLNRNGWKIDASINHQAHSTKVRITSRGWETSGDGRNQKRNSNGLGHTADITQVSYQAT